MSDFAGKWNKVHSDNFEEYLKAVGVGLLTRKIGASVQASQKIAIDGDSWKIVTESAVKNFTLEFELGKEFEETTGDGRVVMSTITLEDNKLIHVQKGEVDSTGHGEFGKPGVVSAVL